MNEKDTALAYLGRDPVLFANLMEVLRRGSARLLYAGPDGVLLFEEESGAHMMSAAPASEDRLLSLVPPDCRTLVGHELSYYQKAKERWGFQESQICYSSAYLSRRPLPLPPFRGRVRLLSPSLAQWVYDHYSHPFGGVEYMRKAIARGMLGVFVDESPFPAGFVGFHAEGSMGMLEVLPPYRRQGLGEILQRSAVNLALERGCIPFGQVFDDNAASLSLQRKLGMELSSSKMFWLF